MIGKLKTGLIAALLGVVVSSPAFAVVLTFSEFPVGTVITTQYAPDGVVFSGLTGLDPIIADDGAMPTEPVLSPNPPYAGDFQWTFPGGATGVSFISGFWDDLASAVVEVYDTANNLLDTLTNTATGVYTFDLSGYGTIGRVTFNSSADGAGADIDNLTFTPVPEPASLLLLGAGLAAFGLIRRRKAA